MSRLKFTSVFGFCNFTWTLLLPFSGNSSNWFGGQISLGVGYSVKHKRNNENFTKKTLNDETYLYIFHHHSHAIYRHFHKSWDMFLKLDNYFCVHCCVGMRKLIMRYVHFSPLDGNKNNSYLLGHRSRHSLPGRFIIFMRPVSLELSTGRLHSRYPWTGGKSALHATITRFNGFSTVAAFLYVFPPTAASHSHLRCDEKANGKMRMREKVFVQI